MEFDWSKLKYQLIESLSSDIVKSMKGSMEEEDLILFLSFDLVNSSSYKTKNYTNWFPVLIEIIGKINSYVIKKIDNSQLWRTIGDEAVFIVNITSIEQLQSSIQYGFEILNAVIKEIKDGTILKDIFNQKDIDIFIAQNTLSLKSTAWIATVHNTSDFKKDTTQSHNLMYMYNYNGYMPTYEFQGNDIDVGFRISKYNSRDRRLALSLELAYLLSENQNIDTKINIVTYKELKGIWDEKLYPVIWYHDEDYTRCKLQDSFFYDEYYIDDICKEYIDKKFGQIQLGNKNTTFQKLNKIVIDKNMIKKLNSIKELLSKKTKAKKLIEGSKMLEVHCVAVCIDFDTREIFMVKRSDENSIFPGLWEFGCSEIQSGQSFSSNLEKDYKNNFGIDIKVLDPIKEYSFENKDKKIIPGVRFIAKIIDKSQLKVQNKYCDKKFITFDDFRKTEDDDKKTYIDYEEFLHVIEACGEYLDIYNKQGE